MAVAALVLAIIALLFSFLPFINMFAFLLVILAIIFGIIGLVGICRNQKSGMGMAIASLIIAAIAGGAILLSGAVYTARSTRQARSSTRQPAMPPKRSLAVKST